MATTPTTELPIDALPLSSESTLPGEVSATSDTTAATEEEHSEGGLAVLGIDTPFLIAQVVNFLLLLFILRWLLYRPILAVLNKRRTTIEESLKQAERAAQAAAEAQEQSAQVMATARTQAKEIVDDAKAQATSIAEQLKQAAADEAAALLVRTRSQLEQEKALVLTKAESELGTLVALATQKVLGSQSVAVDPSDIAKAITAAKDNR